MYSEHIHRAILISVDTVPSILELGQTSHQLHPSKQLWVPLAFTSKRSGRSFPRGNQAKLLINLYIHGNYTSTPSLRLNQEYYDEEAFPFTFVKY
jgi:hypothetical protein